MLSGEPSAYGLVPMRVLQEDVETYSSFLDSFVECPLAVEIVLDNARSHASYCETVDAVQTRKTASSKRKAATRMLQEAKDEQEVELDLDDLRDCAPTGNYLHNSYPGREDVPGTHCFNKGLNKALLCRWASSSDSDFAYVPSHFSFDRMLKEASSATDSARTNVSRPVRRNSLKTSEVAAVKSPVNRPNCAEFPFFQCTLDVETVNATM